MTNWRDATKKDVEIPSAKNELELIEKQYERESTKKKNTKKKSTKKKSTKKKAAKEYYNVLFKEQRIFSCLLCFILGVLSYAISNIVFENYGYLITPSVEMTSISNENYKMINKNTIDINQLKNNYESIFNYINHISEVKYIINNIKDIETMINDVTHFKLMIHKAESECSVKSEEIRNKKLDNNSLQSVLK